ncbi:peptide/nickel transport system substrate-binding protein [Brevibacterium sanguinis]|uniref:Peptide/nickel transport system substrate-binding protein n=2 Tax=Brevibacterium TaxID=1696 RepID=A0A366IIB8_9MICO|nr:MULTISPECIES: ABC transporter substrate-binding protein [Brevibacterium]RBP63605.1 peptide/nickel transport system substrate-binding protein [Brevibacterium sanguinis]RBP70264.1 peptide/nickel transport system substrate-binding protein [Brevibacterium celere]
MKKRALPIVALVAAGVMLLSSCGSGGTDAQGDSQAVVDPKTGFATYTGEPQKGGVVNVLGGVDFSHLDPAMGSDGNVLNLYNLLYRNLTQYKYNRETGELELVGDLAEDTGTPNADSTEWTFRLKEGVTFEDGSPITAEDVKFGIEHSFDPTLAIGLDYLQTYIEGAADYKGVFQDPKGLDSIKVVDDRTITIRTNEPMADFPNVIATAPGAPFPKDKVTKVDQIKNDPISSGPYKVEEYKPGESLTLVRNENWNADTDDIRPAYPDGYKFTVSLDQNTIDQRMMSGQGEDANAVSASTNPVVAANLAKITQDPKLAARTVQGLPSCNYFMIMNTSKDPLQDRKVREAISWATDKSSVVNASGGPQLADVAPNLLLPNVPDYEDYNPYATEGDKGDPEKAKQLLKEAGAEGLKLTMDVRALPMWQAQAEAVQQSLGKAGIEVELNVIDQAKFYEVIATKSQQNELAISGWCSNGWFSGEPLLGPLFDGTRITDTGNLNQSQIDDPELNKALAEAAVIPDLDEKNAAYAAINKQVVDLAPVVPLVRPRPLQLVGSNVGGAFANPSKTGYIDYSQLGLLEPEG